MLITKGQILLFIDFFLFFLIKSCLDHFGILEKHFSGIVASPDLLNSRCGKVATSVQSIKIKLLFCTLN